MRVLIIGGTGNISREFAQATIARGIDTYILTRGSRRAPDGASVLVADVHDATSLELMLTGREFDVVVDFLCFDPARAREAIGHFSGRTGQYIFISSASAYEKPARSHLIDERTPLANPFWEYSRQKIACEQIFMEAFRRDGFPLTVVRPSHTYGRSWIPTAFASADFSVAARMLAGKEIIVPGDGQALWTLTHARDFSVGLAGLLGKPEAIGEAFTIAGEDARSWDAIHRVVGAALGVEPRIVHIPSEFIALLDTGLGERLLGDKAYSCLFDCSKLKRIVPEFKTSVWLEEGVEESVAWRRADPVRMVTDGVLDARLEHILAAWKRLLAAAPADRRQQ